MNTTTPSLKRLAGLVGSELPAGWITGACVGTFTLLLGGCQLADMAQFSYANATASHQWVDEARSTTLHFELIDDHIILPVSINGSEPLSFVLDSGAAATVILESHGTKVLPLELGAELPVSGVGTGPDPVARIVADTDLSLGSVRLEGLSVIYLPLASVPFFENLDEVYFDGVIGAPFFERFVVEIDYDQQLISFSEPGSVAARIDQHSADWQELPLQIQSGVPYLVTNISTGSERSVEVKLLVDTGYRGPVSLTPDTHKDIEEPLEYFSMVSQGLSGDVEIKVGMSESLSVGGFVLNDVPVSYSIAGGESENGSNGLIGNEVLSRFNLVFDYPNKRLFVSPNQHFAEPISADRSGLLIRPHQLGAVVKSVATDSAGEGSELRVDDIIVSLDNKPMTRSNITELKRLLSSDRETVPVCWLSNDQTRCGNLALASRFDQHEL
jgi:hypothetical protein